MSEARTVVVPCFNEARRIDLGRFTELLDAGVHLLFVDDGSTDDTRAVLSTFAEAHPEQARLVALERNRGKAEAVREGLRAAIDAGASVVGYLDADLATPPAQMLEVLAALDGHQVSLGSRVALLGRQIDRSAHRHVLGRVFATFASLALNLRVYDTQCGAKAFRVTPALTAALEQPFSARWAFDVELLGRLLAPPAGVPAVPPEQFVEVPLARWSDVRGSKLSLPQMAKAGLDIVGMAVRRRF